MHVYAHTHSFLPKKTLELIFCNTLACWTHNEDVKGLTVLQAGGKNWDFLKSWPVLFSEWSLGVWNSQKEPPVFQKSKMLAKGRRRNTGEKQWGSFFSFLYQPQLAFIHITYGFTGWGLIPHCTWNLSKYLKLTAFSNHGIFLWGTEPSKVLSSLAPIQQSTQTPAYISLCSRTNLKLSMCLSALPKRGGITHIPEVKHVLKVLSWIQVGTIGK